MTTRDTQRRTVADFTIRQGERVRFSLSHAPSHMPPPRMPDADKAMEDAYHRSNPRPCTREDMVKLS